MKRLNLQNDNKLKKNKNGFFDYDATECVEEIEAEPQKGAEVKEENPKPTSQKRFRIIAIAVVSLIVLLLIASVVLVCIDLSDGSLDGTVVRKKDIDSGYFIVPPDWETNIYTLPEYLELDPDYILYSEDGKTTGYRLKDIPSDRSIAFVVSYLTAVMNGDHEKLNNIFSEGYLEANGEFADFPMQKLYNIKIKRLNDYIDSRYEGKVHDYEYFEITYNIYFNDGYFCQTVDEETAMVEGIMVIFDEQGNGKIEFRRDLRPYK